MKKILLLEDDTALGRGICLALQSAELQLTLCASLAQARETLGKGRFDLLLLDVNLPDGSGLESGAEDYITKPFSLAVLRARVNAQLRRGKRDTRMEVGPFVFDFDRMEFRKDGKALELSKTEQKLLRLLVENRGQTLARGTLVDRIWTDGAEYVDENALSVTVKRLRGKLEENPSAPQYLKTVYGIGYTWAGG